MDDSKRWEEAFRELVLAQAVLAREDTPANHARRSQAIRDALAAGLGHPQVAEATGLTDEQVARAHDDGA